MSSVSIDSSNTSATPSSEEKACGYTQLSQGKRHLLVGAVPDAVSTLALSCELLSKQFGETNIECAEAYFYYGKALLEMSRLESGVLGNALDGVPEGKDLGDDSQVENPEKMTDEEKSAVEEKVKEAMDFNFQTCEVEREKAEAEMEEEDLESQEGDNEAMEEEETTIDKPVEEKPTSEDAVMEEETEDETSNLEQAWEMLELAKVLFLKGADTTTEEAKKSEFQKRVSDVYLHLGEISLENENFEQAVEDLTACLNKRKELLPSDSRSIAETHYQLGIAQAYSGNFDAGESCMVAAVSVLSARLLNLKKMESSEFLEKEMTDLQELVKEIEEKVVDFKDMKAEATKKLKEAFSGTSEAASVGDKPVSSIMVKRKPEVETAAKEGDTAAAAV